MKNRLLKIIIFVLIFIACSTLKSSADQNFRVRFKDGMSVKNGDTLEIPLLIDDIKLDEIQGVQDGIIEFSCNIKYDEDVFTLDDFYENKIKYQNYTLGTASYYNESKKLVFRMDEYYLKEVQSSNINIAEVGTFVFNVNEDAKKGEYEVETLNVYGGNDEKTSVSGNGMITKVYIDGIAKEKIINDETEPSEESGFKEINGKEKGINIKINPNSDGTKVTVSVDKNNSIDIGYLIVNDKKIGPNNNGIFEFDTEPNTTYNVNVYDVNGRFLCNDYVVTLVDDINNGTNSSGKENENIDNNKDDNEHGKDQNNDSNKEPQENEKSSPQTGDYVYIAVAILAILTCIWTVIFLKRK